MCYIEAAFFSRLPPLPMRVAAFFFFSSFLWACQMPPLPEANAQEEDGLLLKNVHLYSAQGNQLQLLGEFAEVRFAAQQHLLKSKHAKILWLPEAFLFRAQRLDARMDTQEVWAFAGWTFQTRENAFGEGMEAYAYKDKLGNMYAQTQEPLRLWQEENTLSAQKAHCALSTKMCEFSGAVQTKLCNLNGGAP